MDIFAHGLWTAVVYQKIPPRPRWWAVFFGVAPDLASFGVVFGQRLIYGMLPLTKPELASIPGYVYHLYNYTHSLVVFAVAGVVVYFVRGRRLPWLMGAWGLHIVIDTFTHGTDFFPTPFLWPLSNVHVNSFSWAEPWFMLLNYGALAVAYIVWYIVGRRRPGPAVTERA
jgi:membrane-bound metal-dependent hydrolase YbcI (DUF457 family)